MLQLFIDEYTGFTYFVQLILNTDKGMKALMIGATGATGIDLLNTLLADKDYTEVVIFVRRLSGITHPKLVEIFTDFNNLQTVAAHIKGDVLFSCLGTTLKAAGSKDKQWQTDYDIPLQFATIARHNDVSAIVLLSAYGASVDSKVFYSRVKGALEEAIDELGFDQSIVLRPGLLLRNNTNRLGERISASLLKLLNAVRILKKFRPMPTYILAQKMAQAPKVFSKGKHLVALDKIFRL
jgi:uncharacterized protein YbjT (DUF2867 family)